VVAALTTWALVVPQAIAYAQIAGLPPQAGLFTAFAGLLGYALLGTSRQLVVSPTSSTAAISAALVAPVAMGDATRFGSLSAAP
jgi:sulfate permease, SulP family